ncbi:hypothetical protein WA026_016717 [Henosepilachna vigintioctopunctata]|uniref:B3/B4 tRNA-binding domain-containing protein n=1 Tax=Henosepilachna vigintioctopunctata TaxID=420089 RepID=A0AAW1V3I9_9CUCU
MWPEIDIAKKENRYEIILAGQSVNERIVKEGLDCSVFSLTSLNYLSIHGTSITQIPDDIANLTGLQTLILHSNKLETVNPLFRALEKLKILDLSANDIEELPDIFDYLQNIVIINVSRNRLKTCPLLKKNNKLSVLDLSSNKLTEFTTICNDGLGSLSELKLNLNEIHSIPTEIKLLSSLKVLDVSSNKITIITGNLVDCGKLKDLNLKGNPIADKRLFKLIDQCRTKQVLDYVKQHCPKTATDTEPNVKSKKNIKTNDVAVVHGFKYKINVLHAKDLEVIVSKNVENVRKHILCCVVTDISFNEDSFKKFIQLQNRLHKDICAQRTSATIATHDFKKLSDGNLTYTTLNPEELKLQPLNRANVMTGKDLMLELENQAKVLEKEKKGKTFSGIHKYLHLLEGKTEYPCLLNSNKEVISFPPITNSDISKIEVGSSDILLEVTSNVSITTCRKVLDSLIREMVLLFEKDLNVSQIKINIEGGHKNVYPAKHDLTFEGDKMIQVIRE